MERPAHNGLGVSASLTGSTKIMSNHVDLVPCVREDLKDIFGFYVGVSKIKGGVELDCGSNCTVTFQKLLRLSKIFGTEKIDVNNELIRGGYCETCSYEETQVTIQILKDTK